MEPHSRPRLYTVEEELQRMQTQQHQVSSEVGSFSQVELESRYRQEKHYQSSLKSAARRSQSNGKTVWGMSQDITTTSSSYGGWTKLYDVPTSHLYEWPSSSSS